MVGFPLVTSAATCRVVGFAPPQTLCGRVTAFSFSPVLSTGVPSLSTLVPSGSLAACVYSTFGETDFSPIQLYYHFDGKFPFVIACVSLCSDHSTKLSRILTRIVTRLRGTLIVALGCILP
jgi:hypothetical protein